jgi:acyl-CoA thioesterase-1
MIRRPLRLVLAAALALGAVAAVVVPSEAATPAAATGASWCTSQKDVAIIGTSAETGYGTTGYPTDAQTYEPTAWGWTNRFSQSLSGGWGTVVQNYAHNGAMASDFLSGGRWPNTTGALADIATKAPNLVIIDLGANEFYTQLDPATFAANLKTVIDDVKSAAPGSSILLSIYAQLLWAPNQWASTETNQWPVYATQIYNTAVAEGVALVDMRQYIPNAGSANLPSPSPWYTDNLHLNDAGNLAEYGAFWGWTSSIASLC